MFIVVALILMNTTSGGQLIPSSQAMQSSSVPSNTSLSANALKVYIIYSFVGGPSPNAENEKIRLHLGMMLYPADVQEYGGDYTGVEFWRVKMDDIQRTAFTSANPKVGVVYTRHGFCGKVITDEYTKAQILEDAQLLYHEDLQLSQSHNQNVSEVDNPLSEIFNGTNIGLALGAGTIYQKDAPSDLKVVSWAPNLPSGKIESYAYDPEGGGEATIYIIENGIDGRNTVMAVDQPTSKYYC